ncbi:unnamed protein product [Choristocarpus tenellus]
MELRRKILAMEQEVYESVARETEAAEAARRAPLPILAASGLVGAVISSWLVGSLGRGLEAVIPVAGAIVAMEMAKRSGLAGEAARGVAGTALAVVDVALGTARTVIEEKPAGIAGPAELPAFPPLHPLQELEVELASTNARLSSLESMLSAVVSGNRPAGMRPNEDRCGEEVSSFLRSGNGEEVQLEKLKTLVIATGKLSKRMDTAWAKVSLLIPRSEDLDGKVSGSATLSRLETLTVKELRFIAKRIGTGVGGRKAELIERIRETGWDDQPQEAVSLN